MRLLVLLCFLIGCVSRNIDEIDTFSAGDREYILYLQNQMIQNPDNKELRDKGEVALRNARNRRDQKVDKELRDWHMRNTIHDLGNKIPLGYRLF
jgi:hypothetical protein